MRGSLPMTFVRPSDLLSNPLMGKGLVMEPADGFEPTTC
jgi:hypothetical protein